MATRYAVASGSWSDSANVWSDTDGGAPGAFVPVDGDTFVIRAGVEVLMDVNQSSWSGLAGTNIIRGGVTPGMLYFKNNTNGYLKFQSNAVLEGTLDTNRGRLLANSDGVWATDTPLQISNTAIIAFGGTTTPAHIHGQNLDIKLKATHPTISAAEVYNKREINGGQWFTFNATSGISEANDTITFSVDPPSAGELIMFRAVSGSLPGGLEENMPYIVRNPSNAANTIQVGLIPSSGTDVIQLTQATGNCEAYTGFQPSDVNGDGRGGAGAYATFDTFVDLTAGVPWAAGSRVILVNEYGAIGGTVDQQRGIIEAGFPTNNQIRIAFKSTGGTCDSVHNVGARVYLIDRNVMILSTGTAESIATALYDCSSGDSSVVAIFDCAIVNTTAFDSATQTLTEQYGLVYHSGNMDIPGVMACFNRAIVGYSGQFNASGIFVGNNYAIAQCGNTFTASGTFAGNITACMFQCNSSPFTASGLFTGNYYVMNDCVAPFTASGLFRGNYRVSYYCYASGYTFSGTFIRNSEVVNFTNGQFVASGTFIGHNYVISTCNGPFVASGVFKRNWSVCQGIGGYGFMFCGTADNNQSVAYQCNNCGKFILSGAVLSNSYLDMYQVNGFDAYNSHFNFPVTWGTGTGLRVLCRSFNHRGVANDTRGATASSGSMTHETTEVPSGKSYSHKFTYQNAAYPTMFEWEITRPTNGSISIPVYAKHDIAGLTEAERVHWAIVDPAADPLLNPNNSDLASWTCPDGTTWQTSTLSYTRTDDRPLILRVWARRSGGGNAYVYSEIMEGGGGDFPDAANVLESDTTNGVQGTYHEATADEVKYGTAFGPASGNTGTFRGRFPTPSFPPP